MKRKEREKRKKKVSPLIKLLITAVAGVAVFLFLSSPMFDVEKYEIDGNNYYSDDEIMVMGNCQKGGNIFWGPKLKEI